MNRPPLTDTQALVLTKVRNLIAEKGYAPTYREICDECGYRFVEAARSVLLVLERKGYIAKSEKKARSIRIIQ